jgi:hypothetical protein
MCKKKLLAFSLLFRGFFDFVLCFFASGGFADFSACEPRLEMLDRAPRVLFGIQGGRRDMGLFAINVRI